ncbi:MAG: hypothetical protein J2P19_01800 [Pseudonocardia sp.]|nr:hypothetical protein [Pseudonocardia sp.]
MTLVGEWRAGDTLQKGTRAMEYTNVQKYRLRLVGRDGRRIRESVEAWLDLRDDAKLRSQLVALVTRHTNEHASNAEKWITGYGLEVLHDQREQVLRHFTAVK